MIGLCDNDDTCLILRKTFADYLLRATLTNLSEPEQAPRPTPVLISGRQKQLRPPLRLKDTLGFKPRCFSLAQL